jgi:hypothetical protein
MFALAWIGSYLSFRERLQQSSLLLWAIFLSFPLPFIAILTGWFTAEVGRQPWTVYGVLRTADSVTPFLTARAALVSLIVFCLDGVTGRPRRNRSLATARVKARLRDGGRPSLMVSFDRSRGLPAPASSRDDHEALCRNRRVSE